MAEEDIELLRQEVNDAMHMMNNSIMAVVLAVAVNTKILKALVAKLDPKADE